MLADTVARGEGIGVFECAERRPLLAALAALTTPARVLVTAPFIRPFRWSRLLWTYLLPAFPLVMAFDVAVSCLRVYGVDELRELTAGLEGYHWDIGVLRGRPPLIRITYLVGLPLAVDTEGSPAATVPPRSP